MNILSVLKNRTVANAGWLICGKIIQMLINLFVGLLTARYLGPSNFGLINYANAYIAFFSSVCTLGINSVLVKEFVDSPGEEGKVIGTSIGLRISSSILSAITIITISSFLDANDPTAKLVVALSSLGVIFNAFDVFNYWFQSKLKSKITAIASLIAYSVTAAYKVFLLATGKSVAFFAVANSLDYIVIAVLLWIFYKRENGGKLSFSFNYGKKLLSRSYHFIFPFLMVAICSQTDKIMLKQMINDTEIGYYSTAVSVCNVWSFVLSAIIDSIYPSIMTAFKEKNGTFERKNKLLYAIVFYISLCISLFFTVFAEPVIFILYGKAYLPSVMPLKIITWYTAFSYLGAARNAWIVCKNKQKYLKYIYFSAAISNVVLNLILIPQFGASGAAFASLIAQIITIIVPLFFKGFRENTIMIFEAILFRGLGLPEKIKAHKVKRGEKK